MKVFVYGDNDEVEEIKADGSKNHGITAIGYGFYKPDGRYVLVHPERVKRIEVGEDDK